MNIDEAITEIKSRGSHEPDWLLAMVAEIERLRNTEGTTQSTLSRGNDIERDFYMLKAQEWACEPEEAKERISSALVPVKVYFRARRA